MQCIVDTSDTIEEFKDDTYRDNYEYEVRSFTQLDGMVCDEKCDRSSRYPRHSYVTYCNPLPLYPVFVVSGLVRKYTIRSVVCEASCHPVTRVIQVTQVTQVTRVTCVTWCHSGHLGHLGHSGHSGHLGHSDHSGHSGPFRSSCHPVIHIYTKLLECQNILLIFLSNPCLLLQMLL